MNRNKGVSTFLFDFDPQINLFTFYFVCIKSCKNYQTLKLSIKKTAETQNIQNYEVSEPEQTCTKKESKYIEKMLNKSLRYA